MVAMSSKLHGVGDGLWTATIIGGGSFFVLGLLCATYDPWRAADEIKAETATKTSGTVTATALEKTARKYGTAARPALRRGLTAEDFRVRLTCARLLAEQGDPVGMRTLLRALRVGEAPNTKPSLSADTPGTTVEAGKSVASAAGEKKTNLGINGTSPAAPPNRGFLTMEPLPTAAARSAESALAEVFLLEVWRKLGAPPARERATALAFLNRRHKVLERVRLEKTPAGGEGELYVPEPPAAELERLTMKYPFWVEGWELRARLLLRRGRAREARAAALRVLSLEPRHFFAGRTAAFAAAALDRPGEALMLLEYAIKINPRLGDEPRTRTALEILRRAARARARLYRETARRNAKVA